MHRRLLSVGLVLLLMVAASCDKKAPTSPDPPAATPKPTASITCAGQAVSCTIAFGASTTIAWSSTNATSCTIATTAWAGTSGSQNSGVLNATRNYDLSCQGTDGSTVTATVKVNVGAIPQPGAFTLTSSCLTASSSTQKSSLSWSAAANAATYRVEQRIWSNGSWKSIVASQTATAFSETVPNDADYYYRVFAVNSSGEKISTPAELLTCSNTVPPPPAIPGGPGTARINITGFPDKGKFGNMTGNILHVLPSEHRVACSIFVLGTWWPKPTFANPLTTINADGSWSCNITTGGVDQDATILRADLVTAASGGTVILDTAQVNR